jgi:hypothetical protein
MSSRSSPDSIWWIHWCRTQPVDFGGQQRPSLIADRDLVLVGEVAADRDDLLAVNW